MTAIAAPTTRTPRAVVTLEAAGAPRTRLRITRRGRLVITTLIMAPVVALVLALALSGGEATATSGVVDLPVVTVEAGQTLWQLAASVAPDANPADVVADIIALNDLGGASVMPGQTLLLPERYLD